MLIVVLKYFVFISWRSYFKVKWLHRFPRLSSCYIYIFKNQTNMQRNKQLYTHSTFCGWQVSFFYSSSHPFFLSWLFLFSFSPSFNLPSISVWFIQKHLRFERRKKIICLFRILNTILLLGCFSWKQTPWCFSVYFLFSPPLPSPLTLCHLHGTTNET